LIINGFNDYYGKDEPVKRRKQSENGDIVTDWYLRGNGYLEKMEQIKFEDFLNVDIRAGKVIEAEFFAKARRPAYKLNIDFGPEIGQLQSSAQVTDLYQAEELIGKTVLAVINFPPKRVAGFKSEVLVLGLDSLQGGISLVMPEHAVASGTRLY
jgi:tRNA-binding protein